MDNQKLDLPELVATLQIQNAQKADYVLPAKQIRMQANGSIEAIGTKGMIYLPNEVLHSHLSSKLSIPTGYYKRMQTEAPDLLQANVNRWLNMYVDNKGLMLRTFESNGSNVARGLLSDRYGILDNYDVLFAALEAIKLSGVHIEVREAAVTDKRMYVNIVAPEIEVAATHALRSYLKTGDRAGVGDGVVSGLTITNSEVGFGSFEIRPRAEIIRCMNGMIVKDDRFRKIHLGAKMEDGQIEWSDNTKQKNYELIIAQTKDAVKEFLSEGYLTGIISRLDAASNQTLEHPIDTMQNVVKQVSTKMVLPDDKRQNILNFFLKDGDHNASGVFGALTRGAQELDADNKYELETIAFEMLPSISSFDKPFVSKN